MRFFTIIATIVLFSTAGLCQTEFSLGVEPRDKFSQKIIPAIISVRALDSETELAVRMINDQYVIQVKSETQYLMVIAQQDYKSFRETIAFEKKRGTDGIQSHLVFLEPINPPKTLGPKIVNNSDPVITILDKKTRAVISQATLNVKIASSGQPVSALKTAQGTWSVKLQEYETYVVEVKAPGYENYKDMIRLKPGEPIEINLNKSAKQLLEFQAVDAKTNKVLGARFKVTDNVRETFSGNTTVNNDIYGADLAIQNDPYYLTVSAPGYRAYQVTLNINTELPASQQRQVIKLVKSEALLKIKVVDSQTAQKISNTAIRVVEQNTNLTALDVRDAPTGEGQATINPDRRYVVEVEADGYAPYRQNYEAKSFSAELVFTAKLNKMLDSYVMLSARDPLTNQVVPAIFKIISTQTDQDFEYRTTQASPMGKLTITEPAVYRIETTVQGYKPHKGELNAIEMSLGKMFKYEAVLVSEGKKDEPKPAIATTKPVEKPKPVEVAEVAKPKPVEPKPAPAPVVVAEVAKPVEVKPAPKPVVVAEVAKPKPVEVKPAPKPVVVAEVAKPKPVEVKPEPKPVVIAEVAKPKPVEPTPPPAPLAKVFTFRIVDSKTQKSVFVTRFAIRSQKKKQLMVSRFSSGIYQSELLLDDVYLVEVEATGYMRSNIILDANAVAQQGRIDRDVALTLIPPPPAVVVSTAKATPTATTKKPTKAKSIVNEKAFDNFKLGQTVTIEDNVYFDQGEYILRNEAHSQLDKLASIMSKNTKLKVEIAGHTDNVGDPRQNMTLSEFRAKVIANHLINKGIEEDRITFIGYGQTKPKTTNGTEDDRRRNRRVEFTIREN
jgi:outer membrane protein OmpA-like peptidoglycan-associated protein